MTQEEHPIDRCPCHIFFLLTIAKLKNYDQNMKLNMICNLNCTTKNKENFNFWRFWFIKPKNLVYKPICQPRLTAI